MEVGALFMNLALATSNCHSSCSLSLSLPRRPPPTPPTDLSIEYFRSTSHLFQLIHFSYHSAAWMPSSAQAMLHSNDYFSSTSLFRTDALSTLLGSVSLICSVFFSGSLSPLHALNKEVRCLQKHIAARSNHE